MSRYWSRLAIFCLQTSHAAEMLYTGLEIRAMCSSYPASAPPLQRPPVELRYLLLFAYGILPGFCGIMLALYSFLLHGSSSLS